VIGKHDDEDDLFVALKKFFERSRCRVPIYIKRRKPMKGFETPSRAMGMFFAAFALFILPLSFFKPLCIVFSFLAFIAFLLTDIKQYIFVLKEKQLLFTLYFIFIHFLISVDVFLGILKGCFDWITDKKFREKYKNL
jgi:hypothetical protein